LGVIGSLGGITCLGDLMADIFKIDRTNNTITLGTTNTVTSSQGTFDHNAKVSLGDGTIDMLEISTIPE
jgi:hypothetical protein